MPLAGGIDQDRIGLHEADLCFRAEDLCRNRHSQLAVNEPREHVTWTRETAGDLTLLRVGTAEQAIVAGSGDDHRINWRYAYVAAPSREARSAIGAEEALLTTTKTSKYTLMEY